MTKLRVLVLSFPDFPDMSSVSTASLDKYTIINPNLQANNINTVTKWMEHYGLQH
jgi:hypothetical protein